MTLSIRLSPIKLEKDWLSAHISKFDDVFQKTLFYRRHAEFAESNNISSLGVVSLMTVIPLPSQGQALRGRNPYITAPSILDARLRGHDKYIPRFLNYLYRYTYSFSNGISQDQTEHIYDNRYNYCGRVHIPFWMLIFHGK